MDRQDDKREVKDRWMESKREATQGRVRAAPDYRFTAAPGKVCSSGVVVVAKLCVELV